MPHARRSRYLTIRLNSWMAAALDGIVEGTEAVFEAKFMLPWSFSEEGAAEKYITGNVSTLIKIQSVREGGNTISRK